MNFKKYLLSMSLLLALHLSYAGIPLWTFTPLTPTSISVATNGSATVQYRLTNQSNKNHTLVISGIPGVTQLTTGAGVCANPIVLAGHGSCLLTLLVDGSQAVVGNTAGPVACEQGNPLQCYRANAADSLIISLIPAPPTPVTTQFRLGGTISGLTSTVALQNNGANVQVFNSNGSFVFSMPFNNGSTYNVTVAAQPINQTCSVANGTGTINGANVTNIIVTCVDTSFTLGGTISGLTSTVFLENNGLNVQGFSNNGSFTFSTPFNNGSPYNVTVAAQPSGETCSIANGTGTINNANVTNVIVTCSAQTFTVGGTVTGLTGTVVLLNNGGDSHTINTNGGFTFSTPLADGSPYTVTVGTQPVGQTCEITNGSGTISGSNVTNVGVTCSTNTTLATSLNNLALKTSGIARFITISNNGSSTAENLVVHFPTWPIGTTASTTCASTLAAGNFCTITVTPGANATSNCNAGLGSAPLPGVISVTADNVGFTVTINTVVLNYGCIYQGGYVFAIDDTTSNQVGIGGTTASVGNNSPPIQWDNGTFVTTGASSLTAGAANTTAITGIQGAGNYAATVCTNYTIDSTGASPCSGSGTCFLNWYLPAICQLGPSGQNAACVAGTQNISTNLHALVVCTSNPPCFTGVYWSSTESTEPPFSPTFFAWNQALSSLDQADQNPLFKSDGFLVRCTRDLLPNF